MMGNRKLKSDNKNKKITIKIIYQKVVNAMGKKKRPIKGLESKEVRNGDCYFIFKYPGKVSLIR